MIFRNKVDVEVALRPGVLISLSFGFSRAVVGTPDTSEDKVL